MPHTERDRLIAWDHELREVHTRLRAALEIAQDAANDAADDGAAHRDLLLYCHGFCAALSTHHRGEDGILFPALEAAHPDLRETIAQLRQDHSMIAHLLAQLDAAVQSAADRRTLQLHLEGLAAIMESHFRYEERRLDSILHTLELDAAPQRVLGDL